MNQDASAFWNNTLSKRLIFLTGKGGVGKSTLAWATALGCAKAGKKTGLVSFSQFDKDTQPLFSHENLEVVRIEALSAFREYALRVLKFEKLYDVIFENSVLKTFVHATPGVGDVVSSGKLWDLYDKRQFDTLIVDLPSSGHAVSFFNSPLGVKKVLRLGRIQKETEAICAMFSDPETRVDLVSLPEELPMTECFQLKEKLTTLHAFHFGYLHVNQTVPDFNFPQGEPPSLPKEAWECVTRLRDRYAREGNLIRSAESFALPIWKTSRFAETQTRALLERVIDEWKINA